MAQRFTEKKIENSLEFISYYHLSEHKIINCKYDFNRR